MTVTKEKKNTPQHGGHTSQKEVLRPRGRRTPNLTEAGGYASSLATMSSGSPRRGISFEEGSMLIPTVASRGFVTAATFNHDQSPQGISAEVYSSSARATRCTNGVSL